MKKKIIKITATLALIMGAFLVGKSMSKAVSQKDTLTLNEVTSTVYNARENKLVISTKSDKYEFEPTVMNAERRGQMKYKYEICCSGNILTSSHDESYDSYEEAYEEANQAIDYLLDDYESEGMSECQREKEKSYMTIKIIEIKRGDYNE